MMKFVFTLLTCFVSFAISAQNTDIQAAYDVLERTTNKTDLPIALELKKSTKANTSGKYFDYKVLNGKLHIEASSPVALCRGFYDYVKTNNNGIYSWSGNNVHLPKTIPAGTSKRVDSPFPYHFNFNVVVYGYSTPYWDWTRWEKEIDWMALHGIDMPLALVGYEAIIARVWKKMGLTEEEINNYFVGPAHLPWMRMGNITGVDAPLNADWHRQQIALQHHILDRMKSLGMKPICPGFPGFIPKEFKRIYPDLNIIKTHWGGAFNNYMISPSEDLFSEMSTAFIREWEAEFGANDHYLVDSFNEMDVPFPAKGTKERYELVASYGEKVYQSIKAGNPNATWTMMGWMFGYQRNIWDYETLQALVSKVPDDKMLLLDLAVDYNKLFWHSEVNWEFYKGFFNKPWVYSVIPNMGGKTGMTGILDFYANGHLEALQSPNKGKLIAHGAAPEGIENNEVIYELLADAGWSDKPIDVTQWLKNYSQNRYGSCPKEIRAMWEQLRKSVYGSFTDHPRYNWQFRPGSVKKGSINIHPSLFEGLSSFISIAEQMKDQPLYQVDLAEFAAQYLGAKAEILVNLIDQAYAHKHTAKAMQYEQDFEKILICIDRILSTHPTLDLKQWLAYANKAAVNAEQKRQYEVNAKRIVTIWGPPVDDYSARIWSGLIRDYYLPRWQHYFAARKQGEKFDFPTWEKNWVETSIGCSPIAPVTDLIKEVNEAIAFTDYITLDLISANARTLGRWELKPKQKELFTYTLAATDLQKLKGLKLKIEAGKGALTCYDLTIVADGIVLFKQAQKEKLSAKKGVLSIAIQLPKDVRANNGCELTFTLKSQSKQVLVGEVEMLQVIQ